MKAKRAITDILVYIFLILFAIIAIFPIVYVLASAFKTNSEILTKPEMVFTPNPTLDNFKTAWTSENFNVGRMLVNSVLYTVA